MFVSLDMGETRLHPGDRLSHQPMKTTKPILLLADALKRQRSQLGSHGILDFSGNVRFPPDGLTKLGVQKALVELRLNNFPLSSLESLAGQPKLRVIIADDSKIASLAGLDRHPWLTSLSFVNAPVSQIENFRLAATIIAPKVVSINGTTVTKTDRRFAAAYPPIARALVAAGWIVQYPPPSEPDFRYIASQLHVSGSDPDFKVPASLVKGTSPPTSPSRAEPEPEAPASWAQKAAAILAPLGFPIRSGPHIGQDIFSAVRLLCNVVTKVESLVANAEADG
jgi:hypothetical protein